VQQLAILDSKPSIPLKKSTLSDAVCEIKLWQLQFYRCFLKKGIITVSQQSKKGNKP
jgi:hypothetical protein